MKLSKSVLVAARMGNNHNNHAAGKCQAGAVSGVAIEEEERRRQPTEDAKRVISLLTGSRDIGEANIFFFDVEGLDIPGFSMLVASKFGLSIVHGLHDDIDDNTSALSLKDPARTTQRTSAASSQQHMTLAEIDDKSRPSQWTDASSALRHLTVRQERHLITIMRLLTERHKVRLFLGSPAEDLYIGMPLTLDGNTNRLDIELLTNTIQRRWQWLNQAISHGCSMYVYLRVDDGYFQQLVSEAMASPEGVIKAGNMKRYRAAMDAFVNRHEFIHRQHVVTITILSAHLGDQTALEVAEIVSDFINKQYDRQTWRQNILQSRWNELASSAVYKRECRPVAVHDLIIAGPTASAMVHTVPEASRTVAPPASMTARGASAFSFDKGSELSNGSSSSNSAIGSRGSRLSAQSSAATPMSVASSVSASASTMTTSSGSRLRPVQPLSGSPTLNRNSSGNSGSSMLRTMSQDALSTGIAFDPATRLRSLGLTGGPVSIYGGATDNGQ